jgi:hypothetical protein
LQQWLDATPLSSALQLAHGIVGVHISIFVDAVQPCASPPSPPPSRSPSSSCSPPTSPPKPQPPGPSGPEGARRARTDPGGRGGASRGGANPDLPAPSLPPLDDLGAVIPARLRHPGRSRRRQLPWVLHPKRRQVLGHPAPAAPCYHVCRRTARQRVEPAWKVVEDMAPAISPWL